MSEKYTRVEMYDEFITVFFTKAYYLRNIDEYIISEIKAAMKEAYEAGWDDARKDI
ncbi:MAG: hypothetical protein ACOYL3_16210 [Desulfuromonadaceae bacterium]